MLRSIKHFAESSNRKYDKAVIVVIMSHGANGEVSGSDHEEINLNRIFNYFSSRRCPALKGKPKLFIIDACRKSGEQDAATGLC